jgi:class 3 adenylate cyclase
MIQSLPVDMMIRVAQMVSPQFDIYKRSGVPEGIPISNQNAAGVIVTDLNNENLLIDFVERLIQIDSHGYMGRNYAIRGLDDVISSVKNAGYSFDPISGQFFENQSERITQNWGRLRDDEEKIMAVLRLDIVSNSSLVKQNEAAAIEKAYNALRNIVTQAVVSRLGRLWSWEGDGALGVFLFGQKEKAAVYAAMEILHEMFFYNRIENPLNKAINVRIAVHLGPVKYSSDPVERLKSETIKEAARFESESVLPNSVGVSWNVYLTVDKSIQDLLELQGRRASDNAVRLYQVGVDKS